MDAVALSGVADCAVIVRYIGHRNSRTTVTESVVAYRNIRDFTGCTATGLVLWRQQQGVSRLTKAAPGVFKDIAFDQDALGVFEFQQVLHHEGIAGWPANKVWLTGHPHQGLEEMVVADFDVCRSCSGRTAAEQNAFGGSLKKIVGDFVWAAGEVAVAAADYLCVGAGTNG